MKKLYFILSFLVIGSFAIAAPNSVLPTKTTKVYLKPGSQGSFAIRSFSSEPVNFFLFDLDGQLVHQTTLKADEKLTISGLNKGCYLYSMLQKDETVGEGKLTIK